MIFPRRKTKRLFYNIIISILIGIIVLLILDKYRNSTEKSLSWPNLHPTIRSNFLNHHNHNLRNMPMDHSPNVKVNSGKSRESVEDIIEVDLPEVDGYESILDSNQKLRIHCQTCALVSSSGHLKGSGAGEAINKASCVIRTNEAPTQGFENDVGNRTDIRVIGYTNILQQVKLNLTMFEREQESMFISENNGVKHTIIHWGHAFKNWSDVLNSSEYQMLRLWSLFYPDVNFYSITEEKTSASIKLVQFLSPKVSATYLKRHFAPSTGWFEMVLAMDICGEINVYGMAPHWQCSLNPNSTTMYHYYTGRSDRAEVTECQYVDIREREVKSKLHRMSSEKYIFEILAQQRGNIFFHHPSWNLTSLDKNNVLPYFLKYLQNSSNTKIKKMYKIVVIKRIIQRRNSTTITRYTKRVLIDPNKTVV